MDRDKHTATKTEKIEKKENKLKKKYTALNCTREKLLLKASCHRWPQAAPSIGFGATIMEAITWPDFRENNSSDMRRAMRVERKNEIILVLKAYLECCHTYLACVYTVYTCILIQCITPYNWCNWCFREPYKVFNCDALHLGASIPPFIIYTL